MYAGDLGAGGNRAAAWWDSLIHDHSFLRFGWTNWAVVVPGKLYRSNHPTPARLARAKAQFGIKTLVNLRGKRKCGSDALSRDAARRLGLVHIDMPFESRGAPHRDRILRFAGIYRSMEFPALMHCKSGADRAGLASALVVMFDGGTTAEALRQLSFRYLHVRQASTGILDAFFFHYAAVAEGRVPFLEWVEHEYDEAALRANFRAHGLASFITDRVLHRE
jgi:protein tyrosine phosphatase (PTP) superfamily phosphohydrolase (DUF442 family)